MFFAIKSNNFEFVSLSLKHLEDMKLKEKVLTEKIDGKTILNMAVQNSNESIARELMELVIEVFNPYYKTLQLS